MNRADLITSYIKIERCCFWLWRRQKQCWWRLVWSNQSDTSGWTCVSKRASGCSLFRDFILFFHSVSLDFLALWPRLSSSVLGGVTPGEERKQQARVREFMSERASLWSLMCVWCPTVAGRGTRRGGARLWSRRGDEARRWKGKGRKRRRRSTHLWSACSPPGGKLEKRWRAGRQKQICGAALIQPSFKTTCRNVFTLTRYTNTALGRWLTDFSWSRQVGGSQRSVTRSFICWFTVSEIFTRDAEPTL